MAKRDDQGHAWSWCGRPDCSSTTGTTVRDADTGKVITDLVENGQEFVIAHGGRGGRGNIRFATPKNPAPEISENGEPGEERNLELELKVLADVGLVGFPSVGKSTLLSVITALNLKLVPTILQPLCQIWEWFGPNLASHLLWQTYQV